MGKTDQAPRQAAEPLVPRSDMSRRSLLFAGAVVAALPALGPPAAKESLAIGLPTTSAALRRQRIVRALERHGPELGART